LSIPGGPSRHSIERRRSAPPDDQENPCATCCCSTATARTVRSRNGKPVVTDGPFAETREQLGGFIEIEVDTIDEALEWARRCPVLAHGTAEVRPVAAM
jgi:hypothetical protein